AGNCGGSNRHPPRRRRRAPLEPPPVSRGGETTRFRMNWEPGRGRSRARQRLRSRLRPRPRRRGRAGDSGATRSTAVGGDLARPTRGVLPYWALSDQPKRTAAPPPNVLRADFLAEARDAGSLPPLGPPEVAIAGRSNVGKSTLLNRLAGRRAL